MAAINPNATYLPPELRQHSGKKKPTILAFHGSGSNATIHTVQLARLSKFIGPQVEIESLEGPFPAPAGPGVLPFFEGCGPYFRWVAPGPVVSLPEMRAGTASHNMSPAVETLVRSTVQRIRASGSRVIGLIGFSQGTRVVAGLLKATELRRALGKEADPATDWLDFRFGICVCASFPPPIIPPAALEMLDQSGLSEHERGELLKRKIKSPVFFALGKQDEWVDVGRAMLEQWFEQGDGKAECRTWEIGHHYPVESEDSQEIGVWMRGVLEGVELEE